MPAARKILLMAMTVALSLAAFAMSASADQLATTEEDFRIAWDDLDFSGGSIQCDVTLLGSFHEPIIDKVEGALIGHVTSATVGSCGITGSASVLTETLPWEITYVDFEGSLPNIDAIIVLLVNAAFLIHTDFIVDLDCLYRTTATNPAMGIINTTGGVASTLQADPDPQIPLTTRLPDSGNNCPGTGTFSGTGTVTTPDSEEIEVILV